MAGVRVLVGTAKGAFVLTSDEARQDWEVSEPLFGGWEVYGIVGSPVDPDRLWAAPSGGWFGQVLHRSDDGGATWETVDNDFTYVGDAGEHLWYDGTTRPFAFTRVWKLQPSATDVDTVWAGVEDAALFRSTDAGSSWEELPALRQHPTAGAWQPGAGGMCLHTILPHATNPDRMLVAISAAGVFRTDDGGASWTPSNTGLVSDGIPDETAEVGHCVHKLASHPARPETVFMQKHWDVMRSDDGGATWREISGDLPSDFGFVVDVHAHEPETVYVVPILSDSHHYPPEGRLRVYRSRGGGESWEALSEGLPQADYYHDVLRDAMAVDRLDDCGIYVGTTGGDLWVSPDSGDSWSAAVRGLPRILSVEVQAVPVSVRVRLPTHLRNLAGLTGEVLLDVAEPVTARTVVDRLEAEHPVLRGTIRDHATQERRAFVRYYVDGEDWSHIDVDTPLPARIADGTEPFLVVGAMAGG